VRFDPAEVTLGFAGLAGEAPRVGAAHTVHSPAPHQNSSTGGRRARRAFKPEL
jgi:hypothetical protein